MEVEVDLEERAGLDQDVREAVDRKIKEEKERAEKEEEEEKNLQIAFRCIEAVPILSLDY